MTRDITNEVLQSLYPTLFYWRSWTEVVLKSLREALVNLKCGPNMNLKGVNSEHHPGVLAVSVKLSSASFPTSPTHLSLSPRKVKPNFNSNARSSQKK